MSQRSRVPYLVLCLALLAGCGGGGFRTGGGGGGGGNEPPPPSGAGGGIGTARVHVDVASGKVTVSPLGGGRAVFAGSSVDLLTSTLFDQSGNTGLRVIRVSLFNQSGLIIGQLPDGTVSGLRVFLGDFANLATADLDLRDQVTVSTVAGTGVAGWLDGSALAARLNGPWGLAVEADGTAYVAEHNGQRLRRLQNGTVSTLSGDGTQGNVDGVGTLARFRGPRGMAGNPLDGALIVADTGNACLRRVTEDGVVRRIAGTGTPGYTEGTGDVAQFDSPMAVAVTEDGVIYVADASNNRIRQVELTGGDASDPASYTVSTLAGSGAAATTDGIGTAAAIYRPVALALDYSDNLYLAQDAGRTIRRVTPGGVVTRVAGTGGTGSTDGLGNVATFSSPYGLAWTSDGLVVCEYTLGTLRLVSPRKDALPLTSVDWVVRTLAGAGTTGSTDGPGTTAEFNHPVAAAADIAGNIYVSDLLNHKLRLVTPTFGHLTFAEPDGSTSGEPVALANPDGFAPSTGFGTNTPYLTYSEALDHTDLSTPKDWAFDIPAGVKSFEFTVLVEADTSVPVKPQGGTATLGDPSTYVRTLAGSLSGVAGFSDGVGAQARFNSAIGLGMDAAGICYVADTTNHAIRRVRTDGVVTTVAGTSGSAGATDGTGEVARFNSPAGIAVSRDGTVLYVAEFAGNKVRRIELTGADPANPSSWTVATVAGTGSNGYADGSGDTAQFSAPKGIALDAVGNLFLAESGGNRVRKLRFKGGSISVASNWDVSLVAGSIGGGSGLVNANGGAATFDSPAGIAVAPNGSLFVADTGNDAIRMITPDLDVSTFGAASLGGPAGVAVDSTGSVYITDGTSVSRYSPSGSSFGLLAGALSTGATDGAGDTARFSAASGIVLTPAGNLVVLDQFGACLRCLERTLSNGVF